MAILLHELWREPGGEQTLCLAGPMGDDARRLLGPGSKLVWTVDGTSHFDAMSKYYAFMGWGPYTTEHEWDLETYPEEWAQIQRTSSGGSGDV